MLLATVDGWSDEYLESRYFSTQSPCWKLSVHESLLTHISAKECVDRMLYNFPLIVPDSSLSIIRVFLKVCRADAASDSRF